MRKRHIMAAPAVLAGLALSGIKANAHTTGAHVHGAAQAAIVVNGPDVSISLTSAMYNITGFERAPANADEETLLADAIASLEAGASLFVLAPQADCRLTGSRHSLPVADGDMSAGEDEDVDHNPYRDLEAGFEFTCGSPSRLRTVQFDLMERFGNLEKLDVIVFMGDRQAAYEVTRDNRQIELPAR
jgi:hypothetical protein